MKLIDVEPAIYLTPRTDGQQYYLRHNGKGHVIALVPTRSGKGVGLVIPTLLSWEHSVVVLDIKGENCALTSGWRHQNGHKILRWEPTDAKEGRTGNLSEVLHELTGDDYEDMTNSWKQYEHKRERDVFYATTGNVRENSCHPVVEQVANEMLNRAEEEASSVLSTAVAKLGLYTDPVVARNTAVSDFRIQDIMDNDSPVSLYLVLNPTNIQRLNLLVRLFISQLVFILMPEIEFSGGQMKVSQ